MRILRTGRIKVGERVGEDLTILGAVDPGSSDPVYVVWHHRAWCPMACKFFSSPRRARREADALSSLAHPNIVRCLGVVAPTHMLMEFLEGPTLGRFIARQRKGFLSLSNAIRVAIHLGCALEHVHAKGFLHLDVKPDNAIIVHGRPVLFDFGSMRRQNAPRPPRLAGTDPYIAPEECLLEDVATAADVFSLGVTLYEMLTGELPFPDGTRKDPFPQINRPPIALRSRRPDLPSRLETVVLSCLARDPLHRPAIKTLLSDLHAMIRSGPSMWPAGFHPAQSGRPRRIKAAKRQQPAASGASGLPRRPASVGRSSLVARTA